MNIWYWKEKKKSNGFFFFFNSIENFKSGRWQIFKAKVQKCKVANQAQAAFFFEYLVAGCCCVKEEAFGLREIANFGKRRNPKWLDKSVVEWWGHCICSPRFVAVSLGLSRRLLHQHQRFSLTKTPASSAKALPARMAPFTLHRLSNTAPKWYLSHFPISSFYHYLL